MPTFMSSASSLEAGAGKSLGDVIHQLAQQAGALKSGLLHLHDEVQKIGLQPCSIAGNAFLADPAASQSSTLSASKATQGAHTAGRLLPYAERSMTQRPSTSQMRSRVHLTMEGIGAEINVYALPHGWPSSLLQREGLQPEQQELSARLHHLTLSAKRVRQSSMSASALFGTSEENRKAAKELLAKLVTTIGSPDSTFNKIRICAATLLLLYDAVIIPYVWGFDVEMSGWLVHQLWVTVAYWAFDMFCSFLHGFDEEGQLVLDVWRCSRHYLKSGFPLDALFISLDLATACLASLTSSRVTKLQHMTTALRLLRLTALVRLRKASRLLNAIMFDLNVEGSASSLVRVVLSVLLFTLLFSHVCACVWFYIGENAPTDNGARWTDIEVELANGDIVQFLDLDAVYMYTTVLHWNVDLFTIGNVRMTTTNTFEKLFQLCSSLFALLLSCTVVSILSAILVERHASTRSQTAKLRALRQYLFENRVRPRTVGRVLKQAQERLHRSTRLNEKDVMALSFLSHTLRLTLQYEICYPFLKAKPLLRLWARLDLVSAQHFCKTATSFSIILPQEVLFHSGEEAQHMSYLSSGSGVYSQHPDTSWVEEPTSAEVPATAWLSEAALSTHWIHIGTFEAAVPSQLFMVDATLWVEQLPVHGPFRRVACAYATQFHKRVCNARPPSSSWPDDTCVPFTDYGHMVSAMDCHSRQVIGMDAILEGRGATIPEKQRELLQSQVIEGQSVVFVDESGHLKRATTGVSLEIFGLGDVSLLQIGKINEVVHGTADEVEVEVTPSCMVPGHMNKNGESPAESLQRLLESKLAPLVSHIDVSPPSLTSESHISPDFGIYTEYMQSRFTATLRVSSDQTVLSPFAYGNTNVGVLDCLSAEDMEQLPESPPLVYVLPAEQQGTTSSSHCFAWLSHVDLHELDRRKDIVEWWLQQAHRLVVEARKRVTRPHAQDAQEATTSDDTDEAAWMMAT